MSSPLSLYYFKYYFELIEWHLQCDHKEKRRYSITLQDSLCFVSVVCLSVGYYSFCVKVIACVMYRLYNIMLVYGALFI